MNLLPWKKRPFLCKIGLHKWYDPDPKFTGSILVCEKCGMGDGVA